MDATIISAPSSTKNEEKQRDQEMHRAGKGKQWHSGMMLRICVDSESSLAHSAMVTSAIVHDKHALPELVRGFERSVYRGGVYHSQTVLTFVALALGNLYLSRKPLQEQVRQ